MTDYERLKQLLTDFGVGFEEMQIEKAKMIDCKEGREKIIGYTLFYTLFEFNEDGVFMRMGAWE